MHGFFLTTPPIHRHRTERISNKCTQLAHFSTRLTKLLAHLASPNRLSLATKSNKFVFARLLADLFVYLQPMAEKQKKRPTDY